MKYSCIRKMTLQGTWKMLDISIFFSIVKQTFLSNKWSDSFHQVFSIRKFKVEDGLEWVRVLEEKSEKITNCPDVVAKCRWCGNSDSKKCSLQSIISISKIICLLSYYFYFFFNLWNGSLTNVAEKLEASQLRKQYGKNNKFRWSLSQNLDFAKSVENPVC